MSISAFREDISDDDIRITDVASDQIARLFGQIDDEEIILQALEEQLANSFGDDYEIETSDSGEDALEFFKELSDQRI